MNVLKIDECCKNECINIFRIIELKINEYLNE